MISYPNIKPEIFSIGPLKLRWYGLMYVIGFFLGFYLLKKRAARGLIRIDYRACESFISYLIFGMLLGARLVYCLIYNWPQYSANPVEIFYVWEGGLSFHGAALGMVASCALFARKFKVPFYSVTDTLAFCAGPGLFFGRLGNFINGELYGRPTSVAWAMIFPRDEMQLPRHPSQLYEAFCEGLLIFVILYFLQKYLLENKKFRHGILGGTFLVLYGVGRFLVEYTREPDAQLGLFVNELFSMGQILCFLMILIGTAVLVHVFRTQKVFVAQRQTKAELEG